MNMQEWLNQICGDSFMPHGQCYLWSPQLIWLHATSDSLIALAYLVISLGLFHFVRARKDLPYPGIFLMFGTFIVACGATHLIEVWTIWNSAYWFSGAVKAITAIASVATAIILFRIMPALKQITGPEELRRVNESLESRVQIRTADLEAANARLQKEISDREKAEGEVLRLNQLLQRRVHELQVLFDVLPVGVCIADDPACLNLRANRELARVLSIPEDQNASFAAPLNPKPDNYDLLVGDRVLAKTELPMQVCARENRAVIGFEAKIRHHADGRMMDLLINAIPLHDAAGAVSGCVATIQDVTALKGALSASSRLAAIVTSSEDAIIGRRLDGVVTDWNPGAEKIFGYTESEMIGQPLDRLVPDGRETEETSCLEKISQNQIVAPFETQRIRKDGKRIDISVLMSPIRDKQGVVIGVSKLARDISRRRDDERQRRELDRKLQETQKLESLGLLAGGIAHDFNNLLTAILGNASLASAQQPATSDIHQYLRHIDAAARRAAELCNQMLAYSGRGNFVLKNIDINELVSGTTHLISISIGKTCVLRLNLAPNLPAISADPTQLRQIIMNLIINASEAIGNRSGVIAITTGVARVDEDYRHTLSHADKLSPGDYVFMEVSDNGSGMDAATLSRIFDPFFTTKFTGRGLGLAAVLGIIRGHKGGLKVYSEVGRGTTFKVFLPPTEAKPDKFQVVESSGSAIVGSGRVLVVDDEETVRTVAARMLEKMGYTVDVADDGRMCVEKFRASPSDYVLVLLDLTMPHLDGEETFRQLRHIRPGVRVLLMSGFNEQDAVNRFTGKNLAGFVQKPFTLDILREAVRTIVLAQ